MFIIKKILSDNSIKWLTILSNVFIFILIIFLYNVLGIENSSLFAYTYILGCSFICSISCAVKYSIKKLTYLYQIKGFYNIKLNMFKLSLNLCLLFGFVFSILYLFLGFILAKYLVSYEYLFTFKIIMSNVFIISFIIFLTPILNAFRGYFLGHRLVKTVNISFIIQNFLKAILFLTVIIIAKYFYKVDGYKCLFYGMIAYSFGYLFSFLYLVINFKRNKIFNKKIMDVNEPIVLNRSILKNLFKYFFPVFIINVILFLFNYIDIYYGYHFLINLNLSPLESTNIMSIIMLWSNVFNILIIYFFQLVIISYINKMNFNKNYSLNISFIINISLFILLPLCTLFSFLCKPLWNLFYSYNSYGYIILGFNIFNSLVLGLLISTIILLFKYNCHKSIIIGLCAGLIIKFLLHGNLIVSFSKIGLPIYFGIITSSFIGYLGSFVINLFVLNSKFNIVPNKIILNFFDTFIGSVIMIIPLSFLRVFYSLNINNKFVLFISLLFYFIIGIFLYLFYAKKCNLIINITKDL